MDESGTGGYSLSSSLAAGLSATQSLIVPHGTSDEVCQVWVPLSIAIAGTTGRRVFTSSAGLGHSSGFGSTNLNDFLLRSGDKCISYQHRRWSVTVEILLPLRHALSDRTDKKLTGANWRRQHPEIVVTKAPVEGTSPSVIMNL